MIILTEIEKEVCLKWLGQSFESKRETGPCMILGEECEYQNEDAESHLCTKIFPVLERIQRICPCRRGGPSKLFPRIEDWQTEEARKVSERIKEVLSDNGIDVYY